MEVAELWCCCVISVGDLLSVVRRGAFELAVSSPWALSNWRFVLHGRFLIGGFYSMGAF